jgi:hypothetical protein
MGRDTETRTCRGRSERFTGSASESLNPNGVDSSTKYISLLNFANEQWSNLLHHLATNSGRKLTTTMKTRDDGNSCDCDIQFRFIDS